MDLDRDSDIPLGVQLAWALRARIVAGELAPGERLPGVRELAASAGVNTNTVRAVYARLEADGLLHAEHGRGTFVADQVPVDERLAAVARRALAEARTAGLDPRDLAAALYTGRSAGPPAAQEASEPAARRHALRTEIAALERELADARLARALRDTEQAGAPAGGRLLGEDDLRAQRDELAERLAALQAPAAPEAAVGPAGPHAAPSPASTRSATRPGVSWRPVFGA